MLMRTDPFRELDRLTARALGARLTPAVMPMDAYRRDGQFVVHFDLPGVDPSNIDVTVEKDVLTVCAERESPQDTDRQVVAAERPHGTFTRQLFLGESLDVDRTQASYDAGVLTLRIPVAEHAKPRKVEISTGGGARAISAGSTSS